MPLSSVPGNMPSFSHEHYLPKTPLTLFEIWETQLNHKQHFLAHKLWIKSFNQKELLGGEGRKREERKIQYMLWLAPKLLFKSNPPPINYQWLLAQLVAVFLFSCTSFRVCCPYGVHQASGTQQTVLWLGCCIKRFQYSCCWSWWSPCSAATLSPISHRRQMPNSISKVCSLPGHPHHSGPSARLQVSPQHVQGLYKTSEVEKDAKKRRYLPFFS